MFFNIGDLVTRKSYNNDIVFKIVSIESDVYILNGIDIRLCADSFSDDLVLFDSSKYEDNDNLYIEETNNLINLDRSSFFYLPGKILHIDADQHYLNRCMNFYKKLNILAYGVIIKEEDLENRIVKCLEKIHPDIVVITGHDFFYKNKSNLFDISNYKNSKYFVNAIKKARSYEKSFDKLVIIAGACQSDYEELIKAGSNFASSPKRVNIHALDPAIIASSVALSSRDKPIDIINIISKTKYKEEGIGGIITNGMMYTGYPR